MGVCVFCGDSSKITIDGKPACMACMACCTYPGPKPKTGTLAWIALRDTFKTQFEELEAADKAKRDSAKREREIEALAETKRAEKKKKPKLNFGTATSKLMDETVAFFSKHPHGPLAQAWKLWSDQDTPEENFIAHCETL